MKHVSTYERINYVIMRDVKCKNKIGYFTQSRN